MEFIFITLFILVIIFLVYKTNSLKLDKISITLISFAFLVKMTSGITIWYLYTYYYPDHKISDIYKYFEDGKQLAFIAKNSPSDYLEILKGNLPTQKINLSYFHKMIFWVKPNSYGIYNDNQTIIVLASVLNLISNNQLLVASLYISILSFFAMILLYRTLSPYLEYKKMFFILLFCLPSIALWTTGLLKETIIFWSISTLLYFGKKLLYERNILVLFSFIFCSLILFISKTYLLGFLLPSIVCVLVIKIFKRKNIKLYFITTYIVLIITFITWCLNYNPVHYNFENKTKTERRKEYNRVNHISYNQNVLGNNYNLLEMLRFKQADYIFEAKQANAKSLIPTKKMNGQLSNFFTCIPYGISNGFARPHIFEANSILTLIPAIENFFILSLLFFAFLFSKKLDLNEQILLYSLGTFVVLTYVFLGLLVPVLGNLVRYKAPLLPLLIFCALILLDRSKIECLIKYRRN